MYNCITILLILFYWLYVLFSISRAEFGRLSVKVQIFYSLGFMIILSLSQLLNSAFELKSSCSQWVNLRVGCDPIKLHLWKQVWARFGPSSFSICVVQIHLLWIVCICKIKSYWGIFRFPIFTLINCCNNYPCVCIF